MCYRESLILVIPDIFNRESILGFFRWIPANNMQVWRKNGYPPQTAGMTAKRWMIVTQGQSLQLCADGQVEADVVTTTDSLLTLHLIQRRDSVLASFIIEKFCERGIEVGTIFEFPDSNCSQNKTAASCSNMFKKGSVPFFHKRLTQSLRGWGLSLGLRERCL
jgi:hypothetical protein